MGNSEGCVAFRALARSEQEQLFLDILGTPPLTNRGSWGEWLHTWLEDQAAEGRPLGEIAKRMDFPAYQDSSLDEPWNFLERHVSWLIDRGYLRLVRIDVVF
jgi:hypothetical protein